MRYLQQHLANFVRLVLGLSGAKAFEFFQIAYDIFLDI